MSRKVKWRILSKKFDRFKNPRTGLNRLWIVWLDRNNMEPTGQLERTFSAPIDVPDSFVSFPVDKPWRIELDLDGYARYLKRALIEWELRYKEIRDSRPKSEPDERVLQLAGPKPQDWRLVVLMSRGDPWCLGFTQKRTPAVEKLIGPAPTAKQLAIEKARPKDLRLDPELEALIAGGAVNSFPDEEAEDDEGLATAAAVPLTEEDLDDAGIDPADLDDGEGELTGNVDLDTLEFEDVDLDDDDLASALEEEVDPKAQGGKKQNPRKNRLRPGKE
jgi:hypothetical protein